MTPYRPHDPRAAYDMVVAAYESDEEATETLLRPSVPGDDVRSRAVGKPVGLRPGETLWEAFQRVVEGMGKQQ